jgi:hypothetical protein
MNQHDEMIEKERDYLVIINDYFPFYWVIFSLLLMLSLVAYDDFAQISLSFYDSIIPNSIIFWKFNNNYPFSTDLAKSHTLLLVLIIPFQLFSLFKLDVTGVMRILRQKDTRQLFKTFLFLAAAFLILMLMLPLSNTALLRVLGGGGLAVSILTPLVTSLLPLLVRIMSCFVFGK